MGNCWIHYVQVLNLLVTNDLQKNTLSNNSDSYRELPII